MSRGALLDGVCDCCDGADEVPGDGVVAPAVTQCPFTCDEYADKYVDGLWCDSGWDVAPRTSCVERVRALIAFNGCNLQTQCRARAAGGHAQRQCKGGCQARGCGGLASCSVSMHAHARVTPVLGPSSSEATPRPHAARSQLLAFNRRPQRRNAKPTMRSARCSVRNSSCRAGTRRGGCVFGAGGGVARDHCGTLTLLPYCECATSFKSTTKLTPRRWPPSFVRTKWLGCRRSSGVPGSLCSRCTPGLALRRLSGAFRLRRRPCRPHSPASLAALASCSALASFSALVA